MHYSKVGTLLNHVVLHPRLVQKEKLLVEGTDTEGNILVFPLFSKQKLLTLQISATVKQSIGCFH